MIPTISVATQQVLEPAAAPRPLPPAPVDPAGVLAAPVAAVGGSASVADVLERHAARGLVVLHHGRLVVDWVRPGSDPTARRACFSVTKSFTGTMTAMAVDAGRLDRSARVGDLLPELGASGFADATVGQVADMSVSIAYTEDYTDAAKEASGAAAALGFNDYVDALRADTPGSIRDLLARTGPGTRPHGEAFAYATPCTDVLGWLLERSTGTPYADLLRTTVWDRAGAEHPAGLGHFPDGTPMLGAGLVMTTRDLARCGMVLGDPVVTGAAVAESMRTGDTAVFDAGGRYSYLTGYAYRDQWWLPGGPHRPLSGWGIHGQLLWIDPELDLVIALHSAGADASDADRDLDHDALCRALTALAGGWPDADPA